MSHLKCFIPGFAYVLYVGFDAQRNLCEKQNVLFYGTPVLQTVCNILYVTYCMLQTVCNKLHVTYCMLHTDVKYIEFSYDSYLTIEYKSHESAFCYHGQPSG